MGSQNVAFNSSTQQLKYMPEDGQPQTTSPKQRGCFVSHVNGFIIVLIILFILLAVGLITYFVAVPITCGDTSGSSARLGSGTTLPVTQSTTARLTTQSTTSSSTTRITTRTPSPVSSTTTPSTTGITTKIPSTVSTTTTLSPEEKWEQCETVAEERGECICPPSLTTPSTEPPTVTTLPPEVTSQEVTTTKAPPRATDIRLNNTFIPSHYNIELQPHIYEGDDFSFNGQVEIWVTCKQSATEIILHIDQLKIDGPSISIREGGPHGNPLTLTHWEEDKPRQFLILYLEWETVVDQVYYISMRFNGTHLHNDLTGFYRSTYEEDGIEKYLVVSFLHPTFARRTFPCFDELQLKATFNVTLVRKSTYSSIFNTALKESVARDGDWVADVYEQTVVMSTYLLAFVVSQFEFRETTSAGGTQIRIWSRPSYIQQLDFALEITGPLLEAYEDYTGIEYPLSKLDQIAVPNFAAGAMENWGLITYKEAGLCYNPEFSTTADKSYIAVIIAHELAHQWFGNLVTCNWFDDTWLNEGFANRYAHMAVGWVLPTWRMAEDYIRTVQFIMDYDESILSQPVILPDINHHDDIGRAFSTITYRKGGSIIRMMQHFLNETTFQAGIRTYLTENAYGTAVHEDLYNALEQQAEADGRITWSQDIRNFSMIMQSWMNQMNHPVVKVTDVGGDIYRLTQEVILQDASQPQKYESPFGRFIWDIPITYANQGELASNVGNLAWMYKEQEAYEISGLSAPWTIVNLLQQGFYRVQYGTALWDTIIGQLKTDHTVFPVINRAQLIDDAFRLVGCDRLDEVSALRTLEYLHAENEYLPWQAAMYDRLPKIEKLLYSTNTYVKLQTYLKTLVVPAYNRMDWDNSNPDENLEKYVRALLLNKACQLAHRHCVSKANALYQEWMEDPEHNPIHPDFRPFVYCVGIRSGGQSEYQFAVDMYNRNHTEYIASERVILLEGLACVREPWLQQLYLNLSITLKLPTPLYNLAEKPEGHGVVFDFLKENWDALPFSDQAISNTLTRITDWYSTEYELRKFTEFASTHKLRTEDYSRVIEKKIRKNIAWVSANKPSIDSWLDGLSI